MVKNEIRWETQDGRPVVVTVTLKTERFIGHDDWAGDITKPCCQIRVEATIAGKDAGGLGYMSEVNDPKYPEIVARIGNLGIKQVNADRVCAALAEIENSEYVQQWREKERRAEEEIADYEAHAARVREMMGE